MIGDKILREKDAPLKDYYGSKKPVSDNIKNIRTGPADEDFLDMKLANIPERVVSIIKNYENVLSSVKNDEIDIGSAIEELKRNREEINKINEAARRSNSQYIERSATLAKRPYDDEYGLNLFREMFTHLNEIDEYHKKFINFLKDKQFRSSSVKSRKIKGKGLTPLYPSKMLISLIKLLATINAGYDSKKIRNQTKNLLNSLYNSRIITETVYNHLANI